MLAQNFKHFLRLNKLGSYCGAFRLKWNTKNGKMTLDSKSSKQRTFKRFVQYFLTGVILFQIFVQYFSKESHSNLVTKILAGVAVVLLVACDSFTWTCEAKASEMVLCINGYIQFTNQHSKGTRFLGIFISYC